MFSLDHDTSTDTTANADTERTTLIENIVQNSDYYDRETLRQAPTESLRTVHRQVTANADTDTGAPDDRGQTTGAMQHAGRYFSW